MAEIGYASLGIIPSFDGFARKLDSGTRTAMISAGHTGGNTFGDAAGKSAGSRFGSVFKSAAKAGLVGLGALGVGAFALAKDSISAASDLEESTNKVNQVFGKGADAVFKFSEKAADALGQTNQAARDAAATFGLFGNIAGKTDKGSAKFATRMTTLASDLASFHNTEPEQAVEALGAALRGESEPIRSYGVLLDEATLKAEALRLGLLEPVKDSTKIKAYQLSIIEGQRSYNEAVKEFGARSFEAEKAASNLATQRDLLKKATEGTIPPLTQEQKVLAASSAIFRQTEVAQGDFARTSDGLANQQRRLKARFEDAKAELGAGLLPIMTDAADFLLDHGIPAFEKFSAWFTDKGVPAIKKFTRDHLPEIKDGLKTIKDVAGDVAPVLEGMFDAFNDLPSGLKKAVVLGAAGGIAAKKVGILGGGGLTGGGGLAGLASMAKPIPVIVTNPGFGGGAGGLPGGAAGGKTPKPTAGTNTLVKNKGLLAFLMGTPLPAAAAIGADQPKSEAVQLSEGDIQELHRAGFKLNEATGEWEKAYNLAFEGFRTSLGRAEASIDLVGAKKVNPDLRIPNILKEQDRLNSLGDKLDLVGAKKIRPGVELQGVDRAHAELDVLEARFTAVTTLARDRPSGDLPRHRRRNIGGMP